MEPFDPYEINGGTVAAIAGDNFALISADMRSCSGFGIAARDCNRLNTLTPRVVFASGGCGCDCIALTNVVNAYTSMHTVKYKKIISIDSAAQMISVLMYKKRFFPYMTASVLAGLNRAGKGVVYGYDPIGHYEGFPYTARGQACDQLIPILDVKMTMLLEQPITKECALTVLSDAYGAITERSIYVGDAMQAICITAEGMEKYLVPLRKD